MFVVGPLGIKREDDKVKLYLNKNLGLYGGAAATSPTDNNPDNAKKFGRLILAGPLASLVFAALCLVLCYYIGRPLGIVLYTGAIMSIGIFFATTIPSKTGMFFTDRKRYQRLVTPGPDQNVEMAILRIMGSYSQDNSYRNVSEDDILTLTNDDTPFMQLFGLFNALCYQIEIDGKVNPETEQQYNEVTKSMKKSMLAGFNTEIEKLKAKHLADTVNQKPT